MAHDRFARAGAMVALGAASVLVALAGLGLLVAAAYLSLAAILSPPLAALATGLGALVLAGAGLSGLAFWINRRADARERSRAGASGGGIEQNAALLGAATVSWIDRSPRGAACAAFAAGLLLGYSPAARSYVGEISKSLLHDHVSRQKRGVQEG